MFGVRIGQPILAFALGGALLDPVVAGAVRAGWLASYPEDGGDAVVLTGGLGMQRFTMRLALRDRAGFLAATR